jgi:hypothetical protein
MPLTNREKNLAHEQRQANQQRPVQPLYNFSALESVMRAWVKPQAEELSPYATCNS